MSSDQEAPTIVYFDLHEAIEKSTDEIREQLGRLEDKIMEEVKRLEPK
jgi:hypothetical protein